jgi:hypothetical protein
VTLYLVSACGSAEEFVAAFRRYADRTGLFIPCASPLPAHRRGRLALTLKDGGVMIEGEGEVVQSSLRPTVLHGRPGMTVKFVEPDELSKIVIAELEKARLAMKPAPPSVPPRPATVPAEPRPVVPSTAGRIDAANALAECVVIGDVDLLVEAPSAAPQTPTSDVGSGKASFVVPSIPGSGRMKTPTVPGSAIIQPARSTGSGAVDMRPKSSTTPPIPALGDRVKSPTTPPILGLGGRVKSPTVPPIAAPSAAAKPAAPPAASPSSLLETLSGTHSPANPTVQIATELSDEATAVGSPPAPEHFAATAPTRAPAPVLASKAVQSQRPTSIGFPVARTPFETQPLKTVAQAAGGPSSLAPPARSETPARPVMPQPDGGRSAVGAPMPRGKSATKPPRYPTPFAPVPIVRPPARSAPTIEDETTELATAPPIPIAPSVTPSLSPVDPPPAAPDTSTADGGQNDDAFAHTQTMPARSGGMRASEIMAAVPTEDWTMSPDAPVPTVLPSASAPETTPAPGAKGPPTGNWTIQLDPDAGWSEPKKLETPPQTPPDAAAAVLAAAPARKKKKQLKPGDGERSGNPAMAVASDKPIHAIEWEEKSTGIGEAKIEIDPTLMEPLIPMPPLEDDVDDAALAATIEESVAAERRAATAPVVGVTPSLRMPSQPVPVVSAPDAAAPGTMPTSASSQPMAATPASMLFAQSAPQPLPAPRRTSASSPEMFETARARPGKSKRPLVIALASVAAIAAGVAVMLVTSGSKSTNRADTSVRVAADQEPVVAGSAAAGAATDTNNTNDTNNTSDTNDTTDATLAGSSADTGRSLANAAIASQPAADGACKVSVTSTPGGADIVVAGKKVGVTPAELELPCGSETKLTLRKAKFTTSSRAVTPVDGKPNRVAMKLVKPAFTLKVTSTPSGATITAGGRTMGVTPTMISLPAFEPSAIVLSKPGYASDSKTVTPKANNTSHHVTLQKKKR